MSAGFVIIILFKIFKGVVFLLFGIATLRLLRAGTIPSARAIAHFLAVSPENQVIRKIAEAAREITPIQATRIAVGALVASAVFFAEASFLTARIWWSPYFTIVLTASGIPFEIWEILHRPWAFRRYLLLVVNIAILLYLWARRNEFRENS
jgi:uncharacterized membrane protein (DUF2068 family)